VEKTQWGNLGEKMRSVSGAKLPAHSILWRKRDTHLSACRTLVVVAAVAKLPAAGAVVVVVAVAAVHLAAAMAAAAGPEPPHRRC